MARCAHFANCRYLPLAGPVARCNSDLDNYPGRRFVGLVGPDMWVVGHSVVDAALADNLSGVPADSFGRPDCGVPGA